MSDVVKAAAFKALYIQRDSNPYALAVYLHAAIAAYFLHSREGQVQLQTADLASKAVLDAALKAHEESPLGATAAFGWALIRKLNPAAPGPLHLWGEEKYRPSSECCCAFLACGFDVDQAAAAGRVESSSFMHSIQAAAFVRQPGFNISSVYVMMATQHSFTHIL